MIRLMSPTAVHETAAIEYIEEFHRFHSEVHGSGGLDGCLSRGESYGDWLEKLRRQLDIANMPPDKAPCITYFAMRTEDMRIVGMVNIRLGMTEFLRREAGQIGYSVRPTERRKHYGTEILTMALAVLRRTGWTETIVSCDKENPASAGVIQKCGGVLLDEHVSCTYGETIQRYRIVL